MVQEAQKGFHLQKIVKSVVGGCKHRGVPAAEGAFILYYKRENFKHIFQAALRDLLIMTLQLNNLHEKQGQL